MPWGPSQHRYGTQIRDLCLASGLGHATGFDSLWWVRRRSNSIGPPENHPPNSLNLALPRPISCYRPTHDQIFAYTLCALSMVWFSRWLMALSTAIYTDRSLQSIW